MSEIFLRELQRADLCVINAWRADYELVGMLGSGFRHVGPEIDERWFEAYLNARANMVRLAICKKDDGRIIGVTYLLDIDWTSRRAEFAIQIGEASMRGKGIGKAAARAMLAHAFDDLNLHRIELTVLATHHAALALYDTLGFRREGLLRQAAFKHGAYVDVVMMALLATDR